MSTKIGIIAEGPIDHALLPALLDDLRVQCPRGYEPFECSVAEEFRSAARCLGRGRP